MDRVREFLSACAHDNIASVRAMLDAGLDVDAADEDDVTGLQTAAANGAAGVARELVVRGAALDKANACGWTPLLHAARHGHANVAAFLLQNQVLLLFVMLFKDALINVMIRRLASTPHTPTLV